MNTKGFKKRCYECQRLTHEREFCPLLIKKHQDETEDRRKGILGKKVNKNLFLNETDPLYGVLSEDQVGMNPLTGRQRIAPEVLEGMRQYLNVSSEDERRIHIERVKNSAKEVERDLVAAKSMLQLEAPPVFSTEINKGKGIVFNFENSQHISRDNISEFGGEKLLASASIDDEAAKRRLELDLVHFDYAPLDFLGLSLLSQDGLTVNRTGFFETSSSGTAQKKSKLRKRPPKNARKPKIGGPRGSTMDIIMSMGLENGILKKRKAVGEGMSSSKVAKLKAKVVIPIEGSPNV